jgi:hypothetical protein
MTYDQIIGDLARTYPRLVAGDTTVRSIFEAALGLALEWRSGRTDGMVARADVVEVIVDTHAAMRDQAREAVKRAHPGNAETLQALRSLVVDRAAIEAEVDAVMKLIKRKRAGR